MQLDTLLAEAFSGSSLFAGLDPQRLTQLQPRTGSLREGEVLFQQGDAGEVSYVLLRGVLGLHTGPLNASTPFFRKVVPGELVGEYGPICGEPRSASAVALTPVDYLQLDRDQLLGLLQDQATLQARVLASLAEAASLGRDPRRAPLDAVLIHDASPGSPLTRAALEQLSEPLQRLARSDGQGQGARLERLGAGEEQRLHALLADATRSGELTVVLSDDPGLLSRRNQLLIDRLLILGDGQATSLSLPETLDENALLVRLWPREQRTPSSRPWATQRRYAQVLNLQPERPQHLERLARAALRRQNVLVLGGGGSRGFAHIGAIRAMEELGLDDIDMVMGVSIGALVASLAAFEHPAQEIFANLERVIIKARPYGLTLPRDSLFTLANSRRELQRFFGATQIQDSWLPLRCFSANLSSKRLHAWSQGDIPNAVIASMSVPGIFPPVEDSQGQLHVDGGILNNLPVCEARRESDGRIIAISLGSLPQPGPGSRERPSLGRTIIDSMLCASHAETQAQERLADVMLHPDIGRFPFLEWKRYREIHDEGYSHAHQVLREALAQSR
ncbi:patatin-like phospholipase family protein [Vulcanococcus limneticus]|uniref:patatin-like phospholipase family protein n=1 Tax=Vulcanococcus limneticus TaxID=2170428 RepID=UPI00398BD535